MNPYSPLKVFHHPHKLDQLKQGEQPTPAQVQLIISDLCNQDCSFCAYRMSGYTSNELFIGSSEPASFGTNNPKRQIPYEKIQAILDDCKTLGVGAIQITGGGEPLVHPMCLMVLHGVLERGMQLALVTNGTKMNDRVQSILLDAAWVRISIDAGSATTYSKVRRVSTRAWHTVWDNVKQLVQKRDEAGSSLIIGIGFVVTADNWPWILDCVQLARDAGVDNIRLSAVFQPEDESYFATFYKEASDLCRQAEDYNTGEFKVFNNFGDRVADLKQHSPDYSFCGYQHFTTYIGGDLNVYRCCGYAYNQRGLIGSITNQSFYTLWKSQEKEEDFNSFDAKGCERCQFNEKNRTILYALEPNPAHVDFV